MTDAPPGDVCDSEARSTSCGWDGASFPDFAYGAVATTLILFFATVGREQSKRTLATGCQECSVYRLTIRRHAKERPVKMEKRIEIKGYIYGG